MKLENIKEINEFTGPYVLLNLNQDERNNLNKPMTASVIREQE